MHRVALESIREIVIDRNSKIFVRLGRKTESFFSSNQDFVAGEIYQKRSFIDGIYLRKKRFNLIADENVSTTFWNVFYTYVEWKNVILRVVRVIKILVLDGLSGFTQWNLFPEKKKNVNRSSKGKKKELRFKRFDWQILLSRAIFFFTETILWSNECVKYRFRGFQCFLL